jgi:hypothetical protein
MKREASHIINIKRIFTINKSNITNFRLYFNVSNKKEKKNAKINKMLNLES